jgi:hypothetical protein
VTYLKNKREKTRKMQVVIDRALNLWAIGIDEGRGLALPWRTQHVYGRYVVFGMLDWSICSCHHIRPLRGSRGDLTLQNGRSEEWANMYRHAPHKSPHDVSSIRRVLLGTAAQFCRNSEEKHIIRRKSIYGFLNP